MWITCGDIFGGTNKIGPKGHCRQLQMSVSLGIVDHALSGRFLNYTSRLTLLSFARRRPAGNSDHTWRRSHLAGWQVAGGDQRVS